MWERRGGRGHVTTMFPSLAILRALECAMRPWKKRSVNANIHVANFPPFLTESGLTLREERGWLDGEIGKVCFFQRECSGKCT